MPARDASGVRSDICCTMLLERGSHVPSFWPSGRLACESPRLVQQNPIVSSIADDAPTSPAQRATDNKGI